METIQVGLSKYRHYITFYNDVNEEPESYKWGHRVIDLCKFNKIPYKLLYSIDVPECIILIKVGYIRKLKNIIKSNK